MKKVMVTGVYGYGMSDNRCRWVDLENARRAVGYVPQDRAEDRTGRSEADA